MGKASLRRAGFMSISWREAAREQSFFKGRLMPGGSSGASRLDDLNGSPPSVQAQ